MPNLMLQDRTVISANGEDAAAFLQGIITTNVDTLSEESAAPGALLTPQGKILFDFLISRDGDGFRLDIRKEDGDAFLKRLMLYRLRARVTLDMKSDISIAAAWGESPDGGLRDGRFPPEARTWRLYREAEMSGSAKGEDWLAQRIAYGVAELGFDFESADAFPHDVLLDRNHGVDFRKGCYVGQEVVSRMHHRGTARRRPVCLKTVDGSTLTTGADVMAGNRTAGTLGTVAGSIGLAIVRTDRIADALAEGTAITVNGTEVTPTLPAWTGLAFEQKDGSGD